MSDAVIAIDPGPIESAYVVLGPHGIIQHGKIGNDELASRLADLDWFFCAPVAIEMVACYGMPVGAEVFETCVVIGRFVQACSFSGRVEPRRIPRLKVKVALCHTARANDAAIRQRLIDLYGGKDSAIGSKKCPGPLYGIRGDEWAALALAEVALRFRNTVETMPEIQATR